MLDGKYSYLAYILLCIWMSFSKVGSLNVLGRVGFGKLDVIIFLDKEGNFMLMVRSG